MILQLNKLMSDQFLQLATKVDILQPADLPNKLKSADTEDGNRDLKIMQVLLELLSDDIKTYLDSALKHLWPFMPPTLVPDMMFENNPFIPKLCQADLLLIALNYAIECSKFHYASAIAFVIDRFMYWYGGSGVLLNIIDHILVLSPSTVIAPQLTIRRARIMKDNGNLHGAIEVLDGLIDSPASGGDSEDGQWHYRTEFQYVNVYAVCVQIKGQIYHNLGLWKEAVPLLLKSVEEFEKLPEKDLKGISYSYGLLSHCLCKLSHKEYLELQNVYVFQRDHPCYEAFEYGIKAANLSPKQSLFFARHYLQSSESLLMYAVQLTDLNQRKKILTDVVVYLQKVIFNSNIVEISKSKEQLFVFIKGVYVIALVLGCSNTSTDRYFGEYLEKACLYLYRKFSVLSIDGLDSKRGGDIFKEMLPAIKLLFVTLKKPTIERQAYFISSFDFLKMSKLKELETNNGNGCSWNKEFENENKMKEQEENDKQFSCESKPTAICRTGLGNKDGRSEEAKRNGSSVYTSVVCEMVVTEEREDKCMVDSNAVTERRQDKFMANPNAVTKERNNKYMVDTNAVIKERNDKCIVDSNAVTKERNDKCMVDTNAVTKERNDKCRVDTNSVTKETIDKCMVDTTAVTKETNDKCRVDTNAVIKERNDKCMVDTNAVTKERNDKCMVDTNAVTKERNDKCRVDTNAETKERNDKCMVNCNAVTKERNAQSMVDPNAVTKETNDKCMVDCNAVTKERNAQSMVDPNTVTKETNDKCMVDCNAVTKEMNDKSMVDTNAITEERKDKFMVDSNAVTKERNNKYMVDTNVITEERKDKCMVDSNAVTDKTKDKCEVDCNVSTESKKQTGSYEAEPIIDSIESGYGSIDNSLTNIQLQDSSSCQHPNNHSHKHHSIQQQQRYTTHTYASQNCRNVGLNSNLSSKDLFNSCLVSVASYSEEGEEDGADADNDYEDDDELAREEVYEKYQGSVVNRNAARTLHHTRQKLYEERKALKLKQQVCQIPSVNIQDESILTFLYNNQDGSILAQLISDDNKKIDLTYEIHDEDPNFTWCDGQCDKQDNQVINRLQKAVLYHYNPVTSMWYIQDTIVYISKELSVGKKGGFRDVYEMNFLHQDEPLGRYICKRYRKEKDPLDYIDDVICQMEAGLYVTYFNQALKSYQSDMRIHYLPAAYMHLLDANGKVEVWVNIEPFVEGEFLKLTNNYDYCNPRGREMSTAFTHFTYSKSVGKLMVVDLQGWLPSGMQNMIYLTDPQFHTVTGDSSTFDFGIDGFKVFFNKVHPQCNHICETLKLGRPEF